MIKRYYQNESLLAQTLVFKVDFPTCGAQIQDGWNGKQSLTPVRQGSARSAENTAGVHESV